MKKQKTLLVTTPMLKQAWQSTKKFLGEYTEQPRAAWRQGKKRNYTEAFLICWLDSLNELLIQDNQREASFEEAHQILQSYQD